MDGSGENKALLDYPPAPSGNKLFRRARHDARQRRIRVILLILSALVFALHYYIWLRLIDDPGLFADSAAGVPLTVALAVLGAAIPLTMLLRSLLLGLHPSIAGFALAWMGSAFLMVMLLFVADLVRLFAVTLPKTVPSDSDNQRYVAKVSAAVVFGLDVLLSITALANAQVSNLTVKRVRVALNKLPASLEGFRIAQLSDVHVGVTVRRHYIQRMVDKTNALNPDLIAITGDLVDGPMLHVEKNAEPLRQLRAKEGVFFCTGNHEYHTGEVDEWIEWLRRAGIRTLRNERVTIRGGLELAGVDDRWAHTDGHKEDIPKALGDRSKADKPVVLMAHQPKTFYDSAARGVDLQLSGHTHGGQIWPWSWLLRIGQPFMAGLYRRGASQLYVSSGTGYWGPPMRLGAPAEITEITLVRA